MQTANQNVNIGSMISQGWEIFKQNIGGFIGFFIVASILISLSSVTVVGIFLITSPLMVGFYLVADKIYRNEEDSFGNFFGGFRHTLSLFIVFLILMGIATAVSFLIFSFYTPTTIENNMTGADRGFFLPLVMLAELFASLAGLMIYILIAAIPIYYFAVAFSFAPLLIIFNDYSAWESMKMSFKLVNSHLLSMIFGHLILGIIASIGTFAFGFGALITVPLAYCMHYALYRQLIPLENNGAEAVNATNAW